MERKRMKKTVWMLLLTSAVAQASQTNIHRGTKLCDFAPKNTRQIPIAKNLVDSTGITESDFTKAIDTVIAIYSPIVKAHGANLVINRLWADATVNSDTSVEGTDWIVNAYGGLARFQNMTYDAYVAVLCHELGHHLGGFPHYPGNDAWASNEGEADYFATMKGFRTVFVNDDNTTVVSALAVPQIVKDQCSVQHKDSKEISLCIRGSMAGLTLGSILNDLGGNATPVNFNTPDRREVVQTNDNHPEGQCRLDTYFAGATCGVSQTEELGTNNPTQGACAEEKGDHFGFRSHCWYKPGSASL